MKRLIQLTVWVAQFLLLAVLIAVLSFAGWFAITLVEDGISSKAMTYEYSTPMGGWDAWRRSCWVDALPGLAVVEGVIAIMIFGLVFVLRRLFRRFPIQS
jgi:hypothetical protein